MGWGSKRWDLCQARGCMRRTVSGEKERDLDKRWCPFHDPHRALHRETNRKKALFLMSTCRKKMPSAKKLVTPPIYLDILPDPWIPRLSPRRCSFHGKKCVDPEQKWKRLRCHQVVEKSSRREVFPPVPVTWCVLCAGAYVVEPDVPLCHECC